MVVSATFICVNKVSIKYIYGCGFYADKTGQEPSLEDMLLAQPPPKTYYTCAQT